MTEEQPKVRKAHCSVCGGERNCEIRGHWTQDGGDQDVQWQTHWYILECRGCEHVFVQTVSTNSEDIYHYVNEMGEEDYDHRETIRYWPARAKRARPEWLHLGGIDVPNVDPLDAALLELYAALENDLHVLAGIGIRTSFDVASELLKIDPDLSFNRKLDALVEYKHIGSVDRDRLATLVDAGSASAHRGWKPSKGDLSTMMDVLEHFIFQAFVEPYRRKQLDEKVGKLRVPRRTKRSTVDVDMIPAPEI